MCSGGGAGDKTTNAESALCCVSSMDDFAPSRLSYCAEEAVRRAMTREKRGMTGWR